MDAPVDYSIDDLASRTIIKEYGDIAFVIPPSASTFHPADIQPGSSMVTIPGCSMLPESERAAVFAQAKYVKNMSHVLADHTKAICRDQTAANVRL